MDMRRIRDPRKARTDFHATIQGIAMRERLDPGHLVLPPDLARKYQAEVNDMLGVRNPIPSHPPHTRLIAGADGTWWPEKPVPTPSGYAQWKRMWDCKHKRGGHWWHPSDAMIGWFCCGCGCERDGMPKDGT